MSYLVLARKWRPGSFNEVLGQDHVVRTLVNAIESGRIPHAFLFTGPRGVGKTSMARILAMALNSDLGDGPSIGPFDGSKICEDIAAGNCVDVVEIDGASNNLVEDVRVLRDNVRYMPSYARYKVYIIDEVHMLSRPAFNALLKTLEEPPAHVKFVLATTEPHKIPDTILSRCQRFDFRRIPLRTAVQRLANILDSEGIGYDEAGLNIVVRRSGGSMRDALSLLDQVIAYCGDHLGAEQVAEVLGAVERRLVLDAGRAVINRDARAALDVVAVVVDRGHDIKEFVDELAQHLRDMLVIRSAGTAPGLTDLSEEDAQEIAELVASLSPAHLERLFAVFMRAAQEISRTSHPKLVLEMALVRLTTLEPLRPLDDVLAQVGALEARLGGDSGEGPGPGGGTGGSGPGRGPDSPGHRPAPAAPPPERRNFAPPQPEPADESLEDELPPPPEFLGPPPPESLSPPPQTVASPPVARFQATPPPEPELAPAVSQADVPPTKDWSGFVRAVEQRQPRVAAFLHQALPLQFETEGIIIGVPGDDAFLFGQLDADESRRTLRDVASALLGERTELRVERIDRNAAGGDMQTLAEVAQEERDRAREAAREAARAHVTVRTIESQFPGAEVVVRNK